MKAIELLEKTEFIKEDGNPFDERCINKNLDEDFFEHVQIDNVDELRFKELSEHMKVVKLYSYVDIDTELGLFVYCYDNVPYCIGSRNDPDDEMQFMWKNSNEYKDMCRLIANFKKPYNPRLKIINQNDILPYYFQVPFTTNINEEMMNRAYYNGQLCEIVDLLNDELTITIRQFGNVENVDISDMYFGYL